MTTHDPITRADAPPDGDDAPVARLPWLSHRRVVTFVIAWLSVFAIGSIFVSNPYRSEVSAGATPDYWRVMYLHGLLIGLVGLGALVASQVLELRSPHVRTWITLGILAATVPAAIGGIWDDRIPGAEVAMWTQIIGFFAFDEILIVLLLGMILEWRRRAPVSRTLPFVAAALATASLFIAAVMGHIAGWILEFGNTPGIIGRYARWVGETRATLTDNLIGSHSHQMVVAMMALVVALAAQQFHYRSMEGLARRVAQLGLAMIAFGTVGMTAVYTYSAFSTWAPPTWFTSHNGTNGVASDDVVTGVLVMGGGLIVMLAFGLVGAGRLASLRDRPVRIASAWAWLLSFATVVMIGFSIELDETYFGAGDPKATGAAKDAVYTWLHQDVGLLLLPAITLLMVVAERLVARRHDGVIAWSALAGSTIMFVGAVVWVLFRPALHGVGYDISTAGLITVGVAWLGTIWWSAASGSPLAPGGTLARLLHRPTTPGAA